MTEARRSTGLSSDDARTRAVRRREWIALVLVSLAGFGFLSTLIAGRPLQAMTARLSSAPPVAQDYGKFSHTSASHASLQCASCHQRGPGNSARPSLPGHKSCTDCHLAQFVTPQIPMCSICHTDINGPNPPLRGFPEKFNESFNVKFDHAQHVTGLAKSSKGCAACHDRSTGRGAGLSIPTGLAAHNQCYVCHTPGSQSATGRDISSCGTCHATAPYRRTPTTARAFRAGFSHAEHGARQRLACTDCHQVTAGLPQSRQVSSPRTAQHFPAGRALSCMTCHNGRRAFGGDLAFKDCRRCHTGQTFRVPL